MSDVSANRLAGEVALITGGGSGLGLSVARRFLAEGAQVAIFDKNAERLMDAGRLLGKDVVLVSGDVRSMPDNIRAVEQVIEHFGKLSVFVGNAGIYDNRVTLAQMPAEAIDHAFDELFGINVKGYMLGAKAAYPELVRTRGSIVFTDSVSGLFAGFGGFLYVTAKHAISALTRQLAVELAPEVRVNAVAPGYVPTNLAGLDTLAQSAKSGKLPDPENFLLRRVPTTDDYTGLYVMLASRETASTVTGAIVLADGGGSIHPVIPRKT